MTETDESVDLHPKINPTSNHKLKTYKSKTHITLIIINIALSCFYFGYTKVYFQQLDILTMLSIIGYDLDPNVAKGLMNGAISAGALFGALCSSIMLRRLSRRYISD